MNRLDEQHGSRWRPRLSSFDFQTLLQNLTAIKIRATFGENGELPLKRFYSFCKDEFAAKYLEDDLDPDLLNCCLFSGRGYLDNVKLVSAQRGDGSPARWVQTCSCPQGYEGEFCERCSDGFTHKNPADGAFSTCEPCTRDCYPADETPCSEGFYRDPWQPRTCVKCPCPDGVSCSLPAGSLQPRCERCPTGTTGRPQDHAIALIYPSLTHDRPVLHDNFVSGSTLRSSL